MSHDPFQDLFDREIPRSSTPSTTRATLDSLAPNFERAKSRRRARVGAIAAFAVLGTTGGAAALGVGPVAFNNRPPVDFNNGLAGGNEPEAIPETVEPTTTTTTAKVSTSVPSAVSAFDIAVPSPEPSSATDATVDPVTTDQNPTNGSNDSSQPDNSSTEIDNSNDGESSSSDAPSDSSSTDSSSTGNDDGSPSDVPVAGPVTKSTDDGSVTVDIGANGLTLVEVAPADGISYQVEAEPEEISIEFRDTTNGDELSSLKFKLVDGGIIVAVEPHSS